jgi:hypothetical protein
MNTKKIICAVICVLLMGTAVFAEDASVVPAQNLRISANLIPAIAFRFQEWEGAPKDKALFPNFGLGLEYGVSDWLNIQVLWLPGVNLGMTKGYGVMHDAFAGAKAAIMGKDALFGNSLDMILSAAIGINIPLTSMVKPEGNKGDETDTLLWGSVLRVYYDVMFAYWFTLNTYAEAVYYPNQISANSVYGKGMIEHPLDFSLEVEPRFKYEMKNLNVFKAGIPIRAFFSPAINMANNKTDAVQYSLTAGAYIGMASTRNLKPPFREWEIDLRYDAAVVGLNVDPIHRVGFLLKFLIGKEKKD